MRTKAKLWLPALLVAALCGAAVWFAMTRPGEAQAQVDWRDVVADFLGVSPEALQVVSGPSRAHRPDDAGGISVTVAYDDPQLGRQTVECVVDPLRACVTRAVWREVMNTPRVEHRLSSAELEQAAIDFVSKHCALAGAQVRIKRHYPVPANTRTYENFQCEVATDPTGPPLAVVGLVLLADGRPAEFTYKPIEQGRPPRISRERAIAIVRRLLPPLRPGQTIKLRTAKLSYGATIAPRGHPVWNIEFVIITPAERPGWPPMKETAGATIDAVTGRILSSSGLRED